ncbi:amino acid adenylation domain-containing protein [Micromonospora sp. NPDC051925]|uniref:amino acid adenylation domain-containing protein n=1 Tax=Micromonospora sp. NPDC051925 TaxID=3364288 RepID=UPI0037CAC1B3
MLDRQLEYWRRQLAGLVVLELPSDRPRPAVRSGAGAVFGFDVPVGVAEGLRRLVSRRDTTPFVAWLSVFQVLLCRYSGQTDVAVGTPVAGRNHAETEALIGCFVNTLVMRADLSADPTFEQLMAQVEDTALNAYEHQDMPFERLVEELAPARDLSRTPLVQAMFVLQNAHHDDWRLPGLRIEQTPPRSVAAKFDLTMSVEETPAGFHVDLCYSTDLFESATIQRMAGHLLTLLSNVTRDPHARVRHLDMLTDVERRQLTTGFNSTAADYPRHALIHQLVEQRAADRPDAVAISHGAQTVTYRQLNEQANQLAHHLRQHGIGPETPVGICLPPTPHTITAILAVLKAGGAYVPLDPDHPTRRLAHIIDDTATPLIITDTTTRAVLPAHAFHLLIDQTQNTIAGQPTTDPSPVTTSDNLAYIIYTSGSTGLPKGVQTTHHNVVNLLHTAEQEFQVGPDDVWTLAHSYSFDFSVWEMWACLAFGGRLVVVDRHTARDPEALYDLLEQESVTVLNQTPSAFGMLRRVAPRRRGRPELAVRIVIFGGEALNPRSLVAWTDAAVAPSARLVNMYGITETTVHVSVRDLSLDDIRHGAGTSPIGRPIANTEVYLVDADDNLVPIGVPGEILIGGHGLARGYCNRPELTAQRFVPHPFSDNPGARLYRSGDLARRLPDGQLEYLGRRDNQVKIRGFRIELGEIETTLRRHPDIREAVVTTREDTPGDRRLTAYLVTHHTPPSTTTLRTFLQQHLPDHMIPSSFTHLDTIPLTHNGKTDHAALPAPTDRPHLQTPYEPPHTPDEHTIARIWTEVLGIQHIGRHDNFFELGGDSLLSIQVVARARGAGLGLTPRMVFQHQTLATVAAAHPETGQSAPALVQLNNSRAARTMYWFHETSGAVTGYLALAAELRDKARLIGIEARAASPEAVPDADVTSMASAYWSTLRSADPYGPYVLGGWSLGGVIAFETARLIEADGRRVRRLVVLDSALPVGDGRDGYLATASLVDRALAEVGLLGPAGWRHAGGSSGLRAAMDALRLPEDFLILGHDDVRRRLEVMREHLAAVTRYRPLPIRSDVIVYQAAGSSWPSAVEGTWKAHAGSVAVRTVPGDHHGILRRPGVEFLARRLAADLAEMDDDSGTSRRSADEPGT